jgi:hypothetical protein
MVKKKYRALRIIAFLFQVLAWVSLILAIFGAIGAVLAGVLNMVSIPALEGLGGANTRVMAGIVAGIVSAVGVIIFGLIYFVVNLALSEFIYVQIDIEQNTRQSAEALRVLLQVQQEALTPAVAGMPAVSAPAVPVEPYPAEPTVTTATPPQPK